MKAKINRDNDIEFCSVKSEKIVSPYVTSGERLLLGGKYQEAFPLIKEAAENGNPRAMYIIARYYQDGYETVTINETERNSWYEKAYYFSYYKEPLSMYGYAAWCLNDKEYEQNKIYSQIFNDIRFLADSDDALAQVIIGIMYEYGYGIEQDKSKAVEWYGKAAEQGFAHAQCNLGYMYENGYGIEQDKVKAAEWYRKAAEQGHAGAQTILARMYEEGDGVAKDKSKAVEWYRKAAEQGRHGAQERLLKLLEEPCINSSVKSDNIANPYVTFGERLFLKGKFQEAFPLIKDAAENGNPRAMYIMALYYSDGYGTVTINEKERNNWCEMAYSYKEPLSMFGYGNFCTNVNTTECVEIWVQILNDIKLLAESDDAFAQVVLGQFYCVDIVIEQDSAKAVEWFRKAAAHGLAEAQLYLARMYKIGDGVAKDKSKAVEWYRKAAEQGLAEAQLYLAFMYEEGDGVAKDKSKAVEWYRKAAEQGLAGAQTILARMYEEGDGVAKDKSKAVEWYGKAAEQGHDDAQLNLARMYEEGDGVAKDKSKAVEWYRKAAEQGLAEAQLNLARMYEEGDGVAKDKSKAVEWYRKAAEQGSSHAQERLLKLLEEPCINSSVKSDNIANPYVTFGERLFLKGKFQEAFPLIKDAAENGNPRAMYIMALYYESGYETVAINEKERNNWCEMAYSYKEPLSMYGYAIWCLNSIIVSDNREKRIEIFYQIFNDILFLAESNDALAQFVLGQLYVYGYVGRDEVKGVEWYRKAAEQGLADAQYYLGSEYDDGFRVEKDYAKALKWYRKAAEQGHADAQINLGSMYEEGNGVAQNKVKAAEWYRKATEQGSYRAQTYLLGLLEDFCTNY